MNDTTSQDIEEATEVEDEDDFTGCFLEPTANSINMIERIAEANRKLYEDETSNKETTERLKKVQFSESLINFEPETYDSEEFDSSEEGDDQSDEKDESIGKERQRPKSGRREIKEIREEEEIAEDIKQELMIPEEIEEEEQEAKVLLVMLPREQSSSCESIIGEEISCEPKVNHLEPDCKTEETEPMVDKAMKENCNQIPSPRKISKLSLELKCSPQLNAKEMRMRSNLKCKKMKAEKKEANAEKKDFGEDGKVASIKEGSSGEKSGKRSCCIVRSDLPKYNGLRSEYGLSAEQLQERRRKTTEFRQRMRAMRMKKKQEEVRRKQENEESFSQWLYSKRRGGTTLKRPTRVDTLSRSDVYIQTHAVYARNRGVFYSVEYGVGSKKKAKTPRTVVGGGGGGGKPEKSINLERLFDNVSPHISHTYRICIGGTNK